MSNKKDPQTEGMSKGLTQYGDPGFSLFLRKAFIKGAGYTDSALDRPVIGIANTGSAYNPCHGNAPQLIEAIERGVMLAGGLPMVFPTMSIHESFTKPNSMFLRNLMSMDTEELLRAQPMDAVVLIGGCDKTVPAQLMGAASAGLPTVQLITGSMLTGSHRGERVGACTDCRRYWGKFRAEEIDQAEIHQVNTQLVASVGTCSVMGTASTMACIAEALGMTVPGGASPPAVTADRIRIAEESGRIAVEIARKGLTIDKVLTEKAFENRRQIYEEIQRLNNEKHQQEVRFEKIASEQTMLRIIMLAAIVMVLLLLCVVYLQARSKKKLEQSNQIINLNKKQIEIKNKELTDSLSYAQRVQNSLLPREEKIKKQKLDKLRGKD